MISKPNALQALSSSPRARAGLFIALVLVVSGALLWHTGPPSLDDFVRRPPPPDDDRPPPLRPLSENTVVAPPHNGDNAAWPPSYGTLETRLAFQESLYQDYLNERKGLIQKWGPTANTVQTFPHNGQFYTMWDFFIPAFSCPFPVTRVGTLGDGGKFICGIDRVIRNPDCTIYSLGVNDESSFEAAILSRASTCKFYGYDFSVKGWANQVASVPEWQSRIHFRPYKIMPTDNHSANPPEYTIQSLFEENGHKYVDIFKIDIEGAEFTAFESFIKSYEGRPLPFGQLQIEIHVWGEWNNFSRFLGWWEMLEEAGLRPFWTELNVPHINRGGGPDVAEWSFINTRGRHSLVSDFF